MLDVTTIGLDIAKNVFKRTVRIALGERCSAESSRAASYSTSLSCLIELEACGGAHHWARELRAMVHEVRLIPPALCEAVREAA